MSTDKIGELDQAIADIFRESRLTSVKAKPSLSDFDHGTLADIFNESLPDSSGPEPSPSRMDHRELAEIFGEPSRTPNDRPSLDIDQPPSLHLFGEPGHREATTHHMAERTPPTVLESVQPNRAESLLDKIRYIFTPKADARPHVPPAVTRYASVQDARRPAAESPLGFEPESLLFRPADQPGDRSRTRDDVSAAFWSETSETSQTGEASPPSLADIISSVSTDIEPPLPAADEQDPTPSAPVRPHDDGLAAATVTTQDGEDSWRELESLLTERSRSPFADALPRTSPRETSRQVFQQLVTPNREADTARTGAASEDLTAAPANASPGVPTDRIPALPQADDVALEQLSTDRSDDSAVTLSVSAISPADTESALPQQTMSSSAELPLGVPAELQSPSLEAEATSAEIPDRPKFPAPTADHASDTLPADNPNAGRELREATPPSFDAPRLPLKPETQSPALADEPDHIDSAAEIAAAILSGNAESADREQRALDKPTQPSRRNPSTALLGAPVSPMPAIGPYRVQVAAIQPSPSTPSPLIVRPAASSQNAEVERASVSHSTGLDQAEPATQVTTVDLPIAPQSMPPSQATMIQADERDAVSTAFNDAASVVGPSLRQNIHEPLTDPGAGTATAPIDSTLTTHGDVTPELEARSLLSELDLDSAIRLRWVMRDIRANRTRMSPASVSDLAALAELGLVEIRGEIPQLTASGVRELD